METRTKKRFTLFEIFLLVLTLIVSVGTFLVVLFFYKDPVPELSSNQYAMLQSSHEGETWKIEHVYQKPPTGVAVFLSVEKTDGKYLEVWWWPLDKADSMHCVQYVKKETVESTDITAQCAVSIGLRNKIVYFIFLKGGREILFTSKQ